MFLSFRLENPKWRRPPCCISNLCQFGTIRHVHSEVLEHCTKFGSNICYSQSHWRTYAPKIHVMTSRELTSSLHYWSRCNIRIAAMHLHSDFGADIFIRCRAIYIFPKFKMAAIRHIGFVWAAMGLSANANSWCVYPLKISSLSAK